MTDENRVKRWFGNLLIAVGSLIAMVAGGCGLLFGGPTLLAFIGSGGREGGEYLLMALLIGILPGLAGFLLARWGIRIVRRNRPQRDRFFA